MYELTQEDIQSSISAAYDSVTLINTLNALETLTEEETDRLHRNKEHLSLMLSKEWFSEALTPEQTIEITNASV